MNKLEVFFDYTCPFCLKGHDNLKALLPLYPQIEVEWHPCEAHPRPEHYGRHSDLCIQGMYFALDHGADLWEYHERMFKAAVKDRADIENIDVLFGIVEGLLDTDAFRESLKNGQYEKIQLGSNDYAYERSGVWAVPSYRMNGGKLDAVEGVGVSKEQLKAFLDSAEG